MHPPPTHNFKNLGNYILICSDMRGMIFVRLCLNHSFPLSDQSLASFHQKDYKGISSSPILQPGPMFVFPPSHQPKCSKTLSCPFLHRLCLSLLLSLCSPYLTARSLRQGHSYLVHRKPQGLAEYLAQNRHSLKCCSLQH